MGEVEKKEGEKKRKRKRRWRSQDQGQKGMDAWILVWKLPLVGILYGTTWTSNALNGSPCLYSH